VARRKHPENETNSAQRRAALTRVYLRMACPGIHQRARARLADSILMLIDGDHRAIPQRKVTEAQVVEMVWAHSQCVLNQTGRCPLLVFGKQLADEITAYFNEEE
jgi:hypothetical protein